MIIYTLTTSGNGITETSVHTSEDCLNNSILEVLDANWCDHYPDMPLTAQEALETYNHNRGELFIDYEQHLIEVANNG